MGFISYLLFLLGRTKTEFQPTKNCHATKYVYIRTNIHAYMLYAYIHTYIQADRQADIHIYIYVCMYVYNLERNKWIVIEFHQFKIII